MLYRCYLQRLCQVVIIFKAGLMKCAVDEKLIFVNNARLWLVAQWQGRFRRVKTEFKQALKTPEDYRVLRTLDRI